MGKNHEAANPLALSFEKPAVGNSTSLLAWFQTVGKLVSGGGMDVD